MTRARVNRCYRCNKLVSRKGSVWGDLTGTGSEATEVFCSSSCLARRKKIVPQAHARELSSVSHKSVWEVEHGQWQHRPWEYMINLAREMRDEFESQSQP